MRPFNLEAAKQHHPIQTRNGSPAKFLIYVPEADKGYRVVVLINGEISTYTEDGIYYSDGEQSSVDLIMAPLGQIEDRDVYPDDELYHKIEEAWVKIVAFDEMNPSCCYTYDVGGARYNTAPVNLTWAKPKTKRVGWINVYPDFGDSLSPTKECADRKKADSVRIACVPVEYEF